MLTFFAGELWSGHSFLTVPPDTTCGTWGGETMRQKSSAKSDKFALAKRAMYVIGGCTRKGFDTKGFLLLQCMNRAQWFHPYIYSLPSTLYHLFLQEQEEGAGSIFIAQ